MMAVSQIRSPLARDTCNTVKEIVAFLNLDLTFVLHHSFRIPGQLLLHPWWVSNPCSCWKSKLGGALVVYGRPS